MPMVALLLIARRLWKLNKSAWLHAHENERPGGRPLWRTSWARWTKKFRNYHRYQVPYYWIIDPQQHIVTVYRYSEPGYVVLNMAGPGETVKAEPFEAVELDVGELFGDLEEQAGA